MEITHSIKNFIIKDNQKKQLIRLIKNTKYYKKELIKKIHIHSISELEQIYPKLKCYTVCIQLNKDIIILEYRTTESLSKHDKIKDIYYTIYKILFYNSNKIKKKK